MNENPYNSPETDVAYPATPLGMRRKVGNAVLVIGLATLAYGSIAFWIIPTLPPNEPGTGRLNTLYVLGAGAVASLVGLAIRETRIRSKGTTDSTGRNISTGVGLLVLLAVIIFVVALAWLISLWLWLFR